MPRPLRRFAVAVACLAATACTTLAVRFANRDDLLAAAGFDVRPGGHLGMASLPASLLPNHFVRQANGGGTRCVHADPLVCDCLYVGGHRANGRYGQEVFQRPIAGEQSTTAMMDQNDAWYGGP